MPKSAKKSASKANSTSAAVSHPTKATKNGKRDAEDTIEKKVVDSKKLKIVNDDVAPAVGKKKEKLNKTAAVPENAAVEAKNDEPESNDSDILDEEDAKSASEASAVVEPAAKVTEEGSDDEEGSEEDDDSSEENDADEEMVDAPSSKKVPQTSETSQATGSKSLFVGNLSFSVEKSDILDFFKDAGEVVEVRLAMRDDRFAGYGHVDFATPDALQKALKLNGELLLDRAVRLDVAKEKGAHSGNERSSQKSGQSQTLTVFVKGFGTDDGVDSVRSTLEDHFGQCGEISRMSIPKDYESDGPKGVAFIDFTDREAFNKALELSGSEVSGCTLTVEEAKQRGGGGGGSGRDRGGRSGGRGRFGGRDGGRGRGRGGRGRGGRGRGGRGRGF